MYISNRHQRKATGGVCIAARRIYPGFVMARTSLLLVGLLLTPAISADELSLGGPPEGVIEATVEQSVEQAVEQAAEDKAQESIQNGIEDRVEEAVLTLGDAGWEAPLEESIEEQVTNQIEDTVSQVVEGSVEDDVEQDVEATIEAIVEDSVETRVEDTVAARVEQNVEKNLEASVENTVEVGVEVATAEVVEERLEDEINGVLEKIEVDENRINKDQWLVMAEPEVFERLAEKGYLFDTVTELPGMGLRLAEVAAPASFDIGEIRQGVIDVVGGERAQVDLNHIYTAGDEVDSASGQGVTPRLAVQFPEDTDALSLRIGMIDSAVDVTHPALRKSHIQTRSFAQEGAVLPSFHGTAIASILAANGADYVGLAPQAELYAAEVFEQDPKRGEIASTVSLVRALDWLISSGVDVINISLAGPPNRLLEAALTRAAQHNVMILAAAGNGGPVAQPMYPAAYPSVVAVTAVDANGRIFRLANRGEYLDIAAPGVDMRHARAGGGYATSSGTSFAVPFAATAVARLRQLHPGDDALEVLYESAEDLGPPGRDTVYGYGLLRPGKDAGQQLVVTKDSLRATTDS